MARKEIIYSDLKKFLLSPGNIFWKKNNGDEVLISKKGDVCNLNLLEKIYLNKQTILIEDEIDRHMLHEAETLFKAYCNEIQVKDKNKWKDKIRFFLTENFINKNKPQLELNLVVWNWFGSEELFEISKEMMAKDDVLFIRTLTIATDLSLLALAGGYYDEKYLQKYYEEVFKCFNNLFKKGTLMQLKMNLEKCRTGRGFKKEEIIIEAQFCSKNFFEEFDGTGVNKNTINEMNEMEFFEMKINHLISFIEREESNFLFLIKEKKLDLGTEYTGLINQLYVDDKESIAS